MAKRRSEIRKQLLERLRNFVREEQLQRCIDDFVDDFIEKSEFLRKYDVEELPTWTDMKWWFQDKPKEQHIKTKDGTLERNYEFHLDSICLEDSLALEIFKHYHSWMWEPDKDIPGPVQELIEIYKKYKRARKEEKKIEYETRLTNIALVGVVRFYHMERQPYFCYTEIDIAGNHFLSCLDILSKIGKKTFPKDAPTALYMFDPFNVANLENNDAD